MASESSHLLPFNTLIHMITIKLSSSNYLLWKSQLLPLLESQDLLGYVDGTLVPPPRFEPETSTTLSTKYLAWKAADQRLLCLLLSFLTEEAIAVVVGLSTAREVWLALENTFNHHSKARELRLKDDLQLMKRGTKPVAEYARTFKTLCNQLHAIGRPVEDTDKVHWFLRGLGTDFSSFSTAQMSLTPLPYFADLVSKAESFELFQRSLESSEPTTAAFTATNCSRTTSHGTPFAFRNNQRGRSHSHNNNSSNRGRTYSGHGRRPPRCQICRIEGHYADRCNQRYARTDSSAHLAEAFNTSCSLSGPEAADWFLDTGASAHMTTDPSILDQSKNYMGKDSVIVGNGASLPITHTGTLSPVPNIHLLDVLAVPHLTKNLLSISKLTSDFPLSVTFTNNLFTVQNRQTGRVVATGKRDGGLYVLERGNSAFISVLKNKSLRASYDLWHARLAHLRTSGIHHQLSCPYTPAQNGRVERKHRHVTETGLALLFHSHLSPRFWVDAFSTATYIINRLPTPLLGGKSPFELLYGYSPHYENFHPFGCRVYPCLRDYMPNKLSPRSIPCIFLGYSPSHKGFRCLDPTTSRLYITRHAQFDETHFPTVPSSQAQPLSSLHISNFLEPRLHHIDPSPPSSTSPSSHIPRSNSSPCNICSDLVDESVQVDTSLAGSSLPPLASSPHSIEHATDSSSSLGSHLMITRAKAGIFKTRHPANLGVLGSSGLLSSLLASTEPKGFKSAAKNPAWLVAMDEEVQALQQNGTWILVPRPVNTNIVGSKWVFRTKYFPDGSVERLKARLVAKGYTQVPGLDYTDTFSPVVKATTVRVVLSLVVTNKWPLRQLDVKNAFLNGTLTEHVYMEQPPGYIDPRFPTHQSSLIYLLLYVDDIIVTGNNPSLLDSFTRKLHSEFATKDLGSLSYFLGLEASPTPDGLFISQLKYARDILTRAQLLDSKPVHTPMVVSQHLTVAGSPFSNPTLYQSLVGALQYLTITRPDIAHAVNSVSQFLHAPTIDHFLAVKRILRYVKGTLHFGLTFRPSTILVLSWSAKKQPTVSRSSCESEYRALAMTAAELLWLMHLLHDLKVPIPQQPLLLCDNKSAIFFSSNPVSHKRAKHVELDYHFLRELVVAGKLRTQYVPSHL
ncbi:Retrovirus-related Pol polyprotein from transposon RE1 [Vitis vinifera]|uniref:Retrovirus-related Pol polyprotein from transposon RE1 n=1 Tax=Vitis vinifera TaxID=29760 RepID=A0A438DCU0_VITVI|nr:Retrovirus-related Pol polyprotein from transposon RE1 [Vitis vinifera]